MPQSLMLPSCPVMPATHCSGTFKQFAWLSRRPNAAGEGDGEACNELLLLLPDDGPAATTLKSIKSVRVIPSKLTAT
jgi:hypothetical protein